MVQKELNNSWNQDLMYICKRIFFVIFVKVSIYLYREEGIKNLLTQLCSASTTVKK